MLKNILNQSGAQLLSKNEQKSIYGGHNCPQPTMNQIGCICRSGQWVDSFGRPCPA